MSRGGWIAVGACVAFFIGCLAVSAYIDWRWL
jgi:hypothetical protein